MRIKMLSAFLLIICRSLGIYNILLGCDWKITLGTIDLLISQKPQRSRKKWDTVLKILVIWIYWAENCTKKLIL